jgi:osmotically-inducible protein OsmY
MENKRDRRSPYSEQENWEQNQSGYDRERDYNQQRTYENYNRDNDYNQGRNYQSYGGRDYDYNQRRNYEGYNSDYNRERGSYGDYSGSDYGKRERGTGFRGSEYSSGGYNDYGSNYNKKYGSTSDYDRWRGESGSAMGTGDMGRDYGNRNYESSDRENWGGRQESYKNQDRGWWDKTKDEVSSWFGDDDAERRRNMDQWRANHKGKGPKNYQRSEERIREDVSDRLSDDPYLDASDIEVKVSGNEVILTGTVDSREAKRRAEDVAESVSGVKNVENHLRVGQSGMTSPTSAGRSAATTGTSNK